MENSEPKILHMENVYKYYEEKCILEDIDWKLSKGEFCTLVGPSGCGKSTLLKIILGEEKATSGKILIDGKPIGPADTNRGIVYQQYSLFPNLNVLENVTLGKKLQLWPWQRFKKKKEIQEEAFEYLERMKLKDHWNKYPHELSGGMQQRVAIAQSLILKPKILLMDEPFGALDPITREEMQIFILELWEETQMTIIFVTHDLEEAAYLGTRIIVLSQYYHDEKGNINHGAKIVADYPLPRKAYSTKVKATAEFGEFLEKLRYEGFNPNFLPYVQEFNLKHPDSFQTL